MQNVVMVDEVPFGVDVNTIEYAPIDDMDADECFKKIRNIERYRQFWLDYYQKKIDEVNNRCDNNIAFQNRKLRDFFNTVPHRSTKTMEAYDLPNGRISMTFATQKLVPNKDAIIKRFEENGDDEFIKTKTVRELDWSKYKSRLFISENGDVLDRETGEIITDVAVQVEEPKFNAKPNNEDDKGVEE